MSKEKKRERGKEKERKGPKPAGKKCKKKETTNQKEKGAAAQDWSECCNSIKESRVTKSRRKK